MPRSPRRPAAHAIRLDTPSVVQGGLAFLLAYLIAWAFTAL
ncbi:MAG: hypothetical protein ACK6DP_03540 [Gemmatimonas sp.]|jgi:hypothetical protein